jgi:hypothetical protein
MKRLALSIIALLTLTSAAAATDFTSAPAACAASCSWNSGASWTGGSGSDWPDDSGDTATISAGDFVVVPAATTITTGAITFANGTVGNETTVSISGTLNLAGAVSMVNHATLLGSPDGILDLNGQTITASGIVDRYTFLGTSGHPFTVQSTTTRGRFVVSGNPQIVSDWNYVNVSGLGDSIFGRSNNIGWLQRYLHSTFVDMESWTIEDVGTHQNWGVQFNNNDVRAPHTATGTDIQANIRGGAQVIGTNAREFKDNTFDCGSSPRDINMNFVLGTTMTITGNVVRNCSWQAANSGLTTGLAMSDNFFINQIVTSTVFSNTATLRDISNNYFWSDQGGYPIGRFSQTSWTFANNILEQGGGIAKVSINWFINGVGTGATGKIQNNIGIGTGFGNLYVETIANSAYGLLEISNNTLYIDNEHLQQGSNPVVYYFTPLFITEQSGVITGGGHIKVFNNIYQNTGSDPNDPLVELVNHAASQLELVEYNDAWPNGPPAYGTYVDSTTLPPSGAGTNDFNLDPDFVNPDLTLGTWDTSLGGNGTATNAIAELLKRNGYGGAWNSDYNPADAVTYIKAGFVPQNELLDGVGLGGLDLGAIPFEGVPPEPGPTGNEFVFWVTTPPPSPPLGPGLFFDDVDNSGYTGTLL